MEVFKRGDFVKHNIQNYETTDPLASGGAFWVLVVDSQNNIVNLEGVEAYIPYQTDADAYENSMKAFKHGFFVTPYGSITTWQGIETAITFDPLADVNGEFHHPNVLREWNHIGNHLIMEEATQFSVKVTNVTDYTNTQFFFVLDEFTTVSGIFYPEGDQLEAYIGSIPKNATGKLVAFSLIENQLYFTSQDVTINGDDHFDLTVAPGTIEDLNALLDTMN